MAGIPGIFSHEAFAVLLLQGGYYSINTQCWLAIYRNPVPELAGYDSRIDLKSTFTVPELVAIEKAKLDETHSRLILET